ncbi:MAG: aldo/keto reductase [bacterium]
MLTRKIWTDTAIPALGLGSWAIGGPFFLEGKPAGWGEVDDATSIRAIHAGVEAGVRFFDTAQAYGTGRSEEVLGRALQARPDVLIGTKIGHVIDRQSRAMTGVTLDPALIEVSLEASLWRLRRDRIDMVHLHIGDADLTATEAIFDRLDLWVQAGKLGAYGWSTDDISRAGAFPGRPNYAAVQLAANVFEPNEAGIAVVEDTGRLAVIRSPLAMGVLGGRYDATTKFDPNDIRAQDFGWLNLFKDGAIAVDVQTKLDAVRELLTSGERSLAQGALGWLWARSAATLPIPGFKTVEQVQDLAGALDKGPLPTAVMLQIAALLGR